METLNEPVREVQKPPKRKGSTRETLYRVTMQNQLDSIGIADQKANILIGINTILISIIIATLGIESAGQGLDFIASLDLSLPFTILLITCVFSEIIALLVVRPVTRPWHSDNTDKFFFYDYKHMKLDEFQDYMKRLTADNDAIYRGLNTDMFHMGTIVIRKYKLLRSAYVIFLIGLITTVLSFLILRYT